MHIITRQRLTAFGRVHREADEELREWVRMVSRKRYMKPDDVRADFSSVDFIGPFRAVFNIHRNDYRLVADIRFDLGRAYIRHVVTHAEYTRLIKRGRL